MSRFAAMYPKCGTGCDVCGLICKRATAIDADFASRFAFMMECLLVDYHGHWNAAAALLDEYKAEWERINPSPPTFMGEPMPPERRERLAKAVADRAETAQKSRTNHAQACTGDVRADVRATPEIAVATRDVAVGGMK